MEPSQTACPVRARAGRRRRTGPRSSCRASAAGQVGAAGHDASVGEVDRRSMPSQSSSARCRSPARGRPPRGTSGRSVPCPARGRCRCTATEHAPTSDEAGPAAPSAHALHVVGEAVAVVVDAVAYFRGLRTPPGTRAGPRCMRRSPSHRVPPRCCAQSARLPVGQHGWPAQDPTGCRRSRRRSRCRHRRRSPAVGPVEPMHSGAPSAHTTSPPALADAIRRRDRPGNCFPHASPVSVRLSSVSPLQSSSMLLQTSADGPIACVQVRPFGPVPIVGRARVGRRARAAVDHAAGPLHGIAEPVTSSVTPSQSSSMPLQVSTALAIASGIVRVVDDSHE